MDSLVFLCACRVVTHHPLPTLPANPYPILFQAAFLDGRPLALRDLVEAWRFPVLDFQWLLGHRELLWNYSCIDCVQAVIQGVVKQRQQVLQEPGCHSSLRVLDWTGLSDSVSGHTPAARSTWSSTEALATACVEVSKNQQELQGCRFKRHKGRSGDAMATPQPLVMDVYINLVVSKDSYRILNNAGEFQENQPCLDLQC